jgi:uncharacterized protein YegJ (DUF2314 family)
MTDNDEQLVPVFMPTLSAVLLSAEDKKGEPLTYDEVIRIRDDAPCIMMRVDHMRQLAESRGYRDIDPENCWHDWQKLRRELGRKPDLDPGPKFNQIRSSDPDYQQTIKDAQNSLDQFRAMLPADGSPRMEALVKSEIIDGGKRAFMWLANTRMNRSNFVAEFFEVPATFIDHAVGDQLEISPEAVLDWMVNDGGVLHGGYSIRYQRSRLPEDEHPTFDDHIGVTKYA